ncbi:outer membrane lipoprotein carrier protein LolA [Mesonia sp. MT50]|uniref:Outer membrane lipoprotein carrier protein LolA n=1 Tax=Mesonia profundi TaxID=3070998 RepID=A0ABU1A2F5_9FLAO|nr:outer membrane lipoprotein carrier protein LolA [Mesonia profundi]MDQ7917882.1 outer membrane lipoprotein carrier protein LolA [Mesonia profundi]
MKKIFLLVAAIGLTSFAQAQNSAKAEKLLNEVSQKVKSYNNMVVDFKYTLENTEENIKQETRGDVSLKGELYRLNLMGITRVFDGKKLYTIVPEDEEVTISTYNPKNDQGITPSKMLTFYEDGYTYKWDITQNVKGRTIQYIKLNPMDSDAEIKEILLGVDVQTKHIYNLIQQQDNGTKVTIRVNTFKTNEPLSNKLFSFDENKYNGYYINRLE